MKVIAAQFCAELCRISKVQDSSKRWMQGDSLPEVMKRENDVGLLKTDYLVFSIEKVCCKVTDKFNFSLSRCGRIFIKQIF